MICSSNERSNLFISVLLKTNVLLEPKDWATFALELLFLETGTIPIRFLLKARRVNYLYNILSKSNNELINQVYYAQKRRPIKDDWFLTVQKDLKDLNIELSENQMKKNMKKNIFKSYVKKSP